MEVVKPVNLGLLENLVVVFGVHNIFFEVVPSCTEDVVAHRNIPVNKLHVDFEFVALLR